MIVYQTMIYRADLQANPKVLYVFGDNLLRMGFGGQAKEMRGEPNAVGIATKKGPGGRPEDFFSDDEIGVNIATIAMDYDRARAHLNRGDIVVCPAAGLGTGLSEMPDRCPLTFQFLREIGLGGVGV